MKTTKLIMYNLITYVTILNITYLFFSGGLDKFTLQGWYLKSIILPLLLITILLALSFMVTYSYIAVSAKHKKNLLRVSSIVLMTLVVISIFTRIIELFSNKFIGFAWFNTFLYSLLLILSILILKDLYKLLNKLFKV